MRRTALTAGVLTAILLPLAGSYAQTKPGFDQTEAERQRRLVEEQRTAGEASRQALPAEDSITYADVLKDPDNIDLNFRYAKAQVSRGNVRGAASTLERILLVTPDLPAVRLVYALVLFRLDNIEEAEREFKALQKLNLSPEDKARIDRYLKEIEQRRQSVTAKVTVSVGLKRDSNVNSAPRDGQALAVGLPFSLSTDAQKKKDYAVLGLVAGEVRKDLGHQARDELIVGASYYHNEQIAIDQQDLQSGSAYVASRLLFEPFTMTPRVSYTNLRLSREKFYSSYGADVLFERRNFLPNFGGIDGFFSLGIKQENFHSIFENTLGPERSGRLIESEAGLEKQITPNHRLRGSVTYAHKLPNEKSFNGYRGHKVSLRHTWLLGDGKFLLTGLDVASNLYKEPDPSVTSFQTRHDTQVRFRVTYGMPVSGFLSESYFGESGKAYYDFLKDWTWTVTGEVLDQGSNIQNFSYQNRRAQTMLTRTWKF